MRAGERMRVPRSGFFLYLRVVRGLSLKYAVKLTRALSYKPTTPNARTARRYYDAYLSAHWLEVEEADFPVLGVKA